LIAHLSGELTRIGPDYVVIDAGGVGYRVYAPLSVLAELPQPGNPIRLLTHLSVKEDSLTLFGFSDEAQQEVFELLISVSGIGPKVALNILSVLPVEQLVGAISREDILTLNRIPGVGNKTAQRIVLELKGKPSLIEIAQRAKPAGPTPTEVAQDVIDALVGLGYARSDARAAAEQAAQMVEQKSDTAAILRAALKILTQGK
jgi:holliday junction DNA helicase RuvA